MPIEADEPTAEIAALCACPVRWEAIPGFSADPPDALWLLHHEWVRAFARVSVSIEELKTLDELLFDPESYEPPEDYVIVNMRARRPDAEALYLQTIGRLGRIDFIRPSVHGKHFAAGGPKHRGKKVSMFYTDLRPETLADLFWRWFGDMFQLEEMPRGGGPLEFGSEAGKLWGAFCTGRTVRIAIDVCSPIGERNGVSLSHLVLDFDLDRPIAHAYPVSEAEAQQIMGVARMSLIKLREY